MSRRRDTPLFELGSMDLGGLDLDRPDLGGLDLDRPDLDRPDCGDEQPEVRRQRAGSAADAPAKGDTDDFALDEGELAAIDLGDVDFSADLAPVQAEPFDADPSHFDLQLDDEREADVFIDMAVDLDLSKPRESSG